MPDIEGVPYETTGTALDVATAQALATRHREVAAAGVRAETAVTAAQARADAAYALADAAATPDEVDQKVSTATTGLVTEAALTEALDGFSGGGVESVSGTVTLDATGEPIREFFTTGQTSFVANGTSVPIGAGVAVVWRRTAQGSWGYQVVPDEWTTPTPTPDTTKPTAGTLASSNVSDKSFTLTVSGASDDRVLHAAPYRFSTDNGATWTAYQASSTLAVTGKTASTSYTCKAEVRDAAGNTAQTASVTVTTTATPVIPVGTYRDEVLASGPLHYLPLDDAAGSTSARNLGSDGTAWTVAGFTFGAAGLGDGATSANASISAGNKITMPNDPVAGSTAWTAEAIIHQSEAGTTATIVGSGREGWMIGGNADNLYPYMNNVVGQPPFTWPTAPAHVAVTYDGTTLRSYRNGEVVAQTAASGPVASLAGGSIHVGATPGRTSLGGRYAGVAVYPNRALSAAEILRHAQAAGVTA